MQAVLLIGIQASGKSSFFKERFFDTHVRINLDMLRTRHRERLLLEACLEAKQPFVVDNTNPSAADRARYLAAAREAGFEVHGYYFRSVLAEALPRNAQREGRQKIAEAGLRGTAARLQQPRLDEGFDTLFYVRLVPAEEGEDHAQARFEVSPWTPE